MPVRKLNLNSGDKLPVQHREYRIDRAKVDETNRTAEILFSTDEPADRWFGKEILDHSPGACDLRRLNDGGAFLKDHDPSLQIGVHEKATVEIVQKNSGPRGEGRANIRFAPSSNPLAEQEFKDLLAGVRTKISVGYIAHEMKLVEEDDDGNETWLVTKWEPLENSLVAIPLDPNCAIGREGGKDEYPIKLDRSILNPDKTLIPEKKDVDAIETDGKTTSHSESENQRTQHMPPVDAPAAPVKTQAELDAEKRAADQKIKDGIKAARKREEEIRAIAKRATVPPEKKSEFDRSLNEAIEKAADDENAPNDFRTFVFDNFFGNAKALETPGSDSADLNGRVSVIGDRLRNGQSVGAEFVSSREYQEKAGKRGTRRSVGMEFEISMLGIRGKVALAQRAQRAFTSSDLAPVNVQIQTGVIGLGMQRLTIMDLIADGATGAAAIIYPRENSFGSVDGVAVAAGAMPRAKAVGERGIKPLWEPDLTTETANVKKIAVRTKVPDEFMSDFPASRSYIDNRLPFMVDTETEFQILYGDGLNNNLKGIFTNANVQTRAIDATNDRTVADSLKKGLTDIEVNSYFDPDAYAFHPYDWETASLLKDSQGRYLMGGPFYIPYTAGLFMELYTFWGKPCVKTTAVTYGRPLAGAWKLGAQYFLREGMRLEMTNANEDDFNRNLISIRAEHRLGLATYRPLSFLEFTGFPART